MSNITEVIFFSLIGGVVSLIGGFVLLSSKKRAATLTTYATPFAAGALLSAAFVDVLSEASHEGNIETALRFSLIGILAFYMLERSLHWFHHHHEHQDQQTDPTVSLIVIGDTLHNFIDGIAIAAGFLVDTQTGIVVTLAVAAHEIPQEIGDFGLLLNKGVAKSKVILVNVVSALATTTAAIIFYTLGEETELDISILLGLVAGMFIYIAASDIIPSIHEKEEKRLLGPQTLMLLFGALFVSLVTTNLHRYIEVEDSHSHSNSHVEESTESKAHSDSHEEHEDEESHEKEGEHHRDDEEESHEEDKHEE